MARLKPAIKAEFNFRWRRGLSIGWILWNSVLLALIVADTKMTAQTLMWIGIGLITSNIFMALFYMAGASAVDIGKIVQGLAELKSGPHHRDHDDDNDEDEEEPTAPDGAPI